MGDHVVPKGFDQVNPQVLAVLLLYLPPAFPVGTARPVLLSGRQPDPFTKRVSAPARIARRAGGLGDAALAGADTSYVTRRHVNYRKYWVSLRTVKAPAQIRPPWGEVRTAVSHNHPMTLFGLVAPWRTVPTAATHNGTRKNPGK